MPLPVESCLYHSISTGKPYDPHFRLIVSESALKLGRESATLPGAGKWSWVGKLGCLFNPPPPFTLQSIKDVLTLTGPATTSSSRLSEPCGGLSIFPLLQNRYAYITTERFTAESAEI